MVWSVVMPLLANWLRAYVIVMVAHWTNNEWGLGVSHLALGWIIFGIAVFVGFAVGTPLAPTRCRPLRAAWRRPAAARWRWRWPHRAGGGHSAGGRGAGQAFAARSTSTDEPRLRFDSPGRPGARRLAGRRHPPGFPGARAVHQARYKTKGGDTVDVFVAYFRNQVQGAELVNVGNKVEPTHDWS